MEVACSAASSKLVPSTIAYFESDVARAGEACRCKNVRDSFGVGEGKTAQVRPARAAVPKAQVFGPPGAATSIHGFSMSGRQQANTSRPPVLNARRKLANAATGSPKNITPKR